MGLLTPLAVRIGAISWLPKRLPQIVAFDKALQRFSRGRVSLLDLAGLPNLMLTVPGRRSGIPRSTPLLAVPHNRGWLVAGSNFGGPKMPVWVFNLRASGSGTVGIKGGHVPVRAREVEGAEREAMWRVMLDTWPNYAKYEERTNRLIPVFFLERA